MICLIFGRSNTRSQLTFRFTMGIDGKDRIDKKQA